jgi:N utilization substance protein B
MTAGKRRTAREMAVQMLYQSDLGASPLPHIFNTFDLAEYLARPGGAAARRPAAGEPALAGAPVQPAGDSAFAGLVGIPGGAEPVADEEESAASPQPASRADHARQKRRVEEAFQYAQALVRGTVDHREEIDSMIRGQADNWRLERMPPVDRNILRLAIYEMLYERDTPKLVVVDEAIELAKKFGSEQSGRFINGLLDGLLKQHTFPGTLT